MSQRTLLRLFVWTLGLSLLTPGIVEAERIVLANGHVFRELTRDGSVWRTTRFARADGSDELAMDSDEFHVLLLDDTQLSLDNYEAIEAPVRGTRRGEQTIAISYRLRPGQQLPAAAPRRVCITYRLGDEPYLRKDVVLEMNAGQAIDRLQVERFVTTANARRGGRGEPVLLNEAWFAGLEYPASYIRHGRNFQYHNYQLRNPSKISLEGRDEELGGASEGLITMAHFPGLAKQAEAADGKWLIHGKTSVFGVGRLGDTIELAFLDYLQTVRRGKPRSYLHHNNWYDASGKDLSVENYIGRTYTQMRDGLAPFGVTLDGMVPDNGWQDRKSVWRSKAGVDLAALRDALAADGGKTHMGLWIALNGYSMNVDWGRENGYLEAQRNEWFKRFRRYYSLTCPEYNAQLRRALKILIADGNVNYFKHDFNEMCDMGEGRGHLPTDRHGHEANVDAMLDLLAYERQLQPDVYQNMTNWIWFSPWWLMHNDCLWMMGSDSGSNWAWPQLALRSISTTFRDEHFARLWQDPLDRPLVPISTLMTHGIIFADRNRRGGPQETLHDWADYVVMYYGRGVMLKELYITPSMMTPERWKVLGTTTKWAVENAPRLVDSVAIGGNPEYGEPHGYVSWTADFGILTLRNPDRRKQVVRVPFDQTTWYRGRVGQPWQARVIYPYLEPLPNRFVSGQDIEVSVPGDCVMVLEFRPGTSTAKSCLQPGRPPTVGVERKPDRLVFTIPVPDEEMLRCDFLFQVFQGDVPLLTLNGKPVQPNRLLQGKVSAKREIAGGTKLARAAKPEAMGESGHWAVGSLDLRPFRGRAVTVQVGGPPNQVGPFREIGSVKFDAWLIADRPVDASEAPKDELLPWAISQAYRRQTVPLTKPTVVSFGTTAVGPMTEADLRRVTRAKLRLAIFGINGGSWGPVTLKLNGQEFLEIPANRTGDSWETIVLDVPKEKLNLLELDNTFTIENPNSDKFKVKNLAVAVRGADETWVTGTVAKAVHCSSDDWTHAEGKIFPSITRSHPIRVHFTN